MSIKPPMSKLPHRPMNESERFHPNLLAELNKAGLNTDALLYIATANMDNTECYCST